MTPPIPDDELRAMLETRADRVAPDAERSVLAGFRATVRAPDGRGGFAVLPQALGTRGARLPWSLAAVGMVAVVVIALLGGRLSMRNDVSDSVAPPIAPSSAPGQQSITPVASGGVVIPPLAGDPVVTLVARQVQEALASGALTGQVVVVDGRLASSLCRIGPTSSCDTELIGYPDIPIRVQGGVVTQTAWAEATRVLEDRPLAFRVRENGVLDFVGTVERGKVAPLAVDQLAETTAPVGDLAVIKAWLLSGTRRGTDAVHGCGLESQRPGKACPSDSAWVLSDGGPDASGGVVDARVLSTDVMPDARPGIIANSQAATFLVRWSGHRWVVEGRVGAVVSSVPEAAPPAAESPSGDPGDLDADELRAGLGDGSLTGRVIVFDGSLQIGQIPCMRLSECLPSAQLLDGVRVTADPVIGAIVGTDAIDGLHVFIGDGVGLTYLGAIAGPVDVPMTAGQLADVSPGAAETEVRFVEGVVGPIACFGCPGSQSPPSEQWLSGVAGSGTVSVPVRVPDTIEPPSEANRYLIRATVRPSCAGAAAPSDRSCVGAALYEWAIVAAVGDEPILRVALP